MTATLWVLLWLLGPQSTLTSVQGRVVRAGTMQPLAGELVGLWPTSRTVKADGEGKFQFKDVAPGEYALVVVHDGMKVQVPVLLGTGRRLDDPMIEVPAAPAIAGTVFDPNGERVAAAHIEALRTVHSPQGPRTKSVMSVVTDDLGDFRLFRLRAGEYYVAASLSERERRLPTQGLTLTPNLSNPDEGLPTIYFGGGYSLSESQKVRLGRDADTTGVQIFLKDGPRYTISGPLLPEGTCARVFVVPEGGIVNMDTDVAVNECASFRVTGLSRGTYSVLAVNETLSSEVIRVFTTNPVTEIKVPLVNNVAVFGRVSRDGGAGLLNGVSIKLSRASRDITQEIEVAVASNGNFSFPGVGPGVYDVSIQPLPERSYLRSATFRAADALFAPIRVDSIGTNRIDLQISFSDAIAEGVVVDRAGRPVPGAEVVLVPKEIRSRTRADRYFATTADAGGNFRVTGIPPVDYALLAYEELEPQAYFAFVYDLGAYNRSVGTAQVLSAGSTNTQLKLLVIPASETAGGLR